MEEGISGNKISVIIPCYQNEENIPSLMDALQVLVNKNKDLEFEFVFVDDGSKDRTYQVLRERGDALTECSVIVIRLLKNAGSYNALLAGMHYATGDANVHLHADLQDPPDLIPELVEEHRKGYKLVIAHRVDRNDGWFQDALSIMFHYFIRKMVLLNAPPGGFDLMLFNNEIKDRILSMKEHNIHLVYMFIWLDYPFKKIPYSRKKRQVGKSSYSMRKRIKLAFDTLVGFSSLPFRIIWFVGAMLIAGAVIAGISMMSMAGLERLDLYFLLVVSLFGMLMISIGVLGEYLWRTLEITRNRPNFMIDNVYYCQQNSPENE